MIPRVSAALCSFGAAVTNVRHDYAVSYHSHFQRADSGFIETAFSDMERQARDDLKLEGFDPTQMQLQRQMEVRYVGELGELTLPVPRDRFAGESLHAMEEVFHHAHERAYTFADRASECELMGLSLVGYGLRREEIAALGALKTDLVAELAKGGRQRNALFSEGLRDIDVHAGETIESNTVIAGATVIEEQTTTIVVPPGWQVRLDSCHAWVMSRSPV